jgi:hypothetical protein
MSLITDLRKSVLNHIGASKVSASLSQLDYEPVADRSLALEPPHAKRRAVPAYSTEALTPRDETPAPEVIVAPDDIPPPPLKPGRSW